MAGSTELKNIYSGYFYELSPYFVNGLLNCFLLILIRGLAKIKSHITKKILSNIFKKTWHHCNLFFVAADEFPKIAAVPSTVQNFVDIKYFHFS